MSEIAHAETEPVAPREAPAKRRKRRVAATPKREVPDEFAGMTATDCCDGCAAGKAAAEAARKRLNEIDAAYPRQPSRIPNNPTVLELDPEWLARNTQVADEFRRLSKALDGACVISSGVCAHPFKSPLQSAMFRDAKVMARYQRAKKILAHQKIDLRGY